MNRHLTAGLVLALALSACAAGTGEPADSPTPTAEPTEQASEPMPEGTESPEEEGGEMTGLDLDAGEIPDSIVEEIVADALEATGADTGDIEVVEARSVTWNDGSLGCPEPGMMYTQALEPGYQLILRIGDETLDYHISERGTFVLCPEGNATEGSGSS